MQVFARDGRAPRACVSPGGCGPRAGSARWLVVGEAPHLRGCRAPIVEVDSLVRAGGASTSVGAPTMSTRYVLLDAVARVRELVRQLAVVRQQQRARRVGVEAGDGDDARLPGARARRRSGVPAGHSRSSPRWHAACSGGCTRGSASGSRGCRRPRRRPSTPTNAFSCPGLTVDGDPAGLDQVIGLAAGGDSRRGRGRR